VSCPNEVEMRSAHVGSADFDRLARQHKDDVYRQMLRVCGNSEDAEDVLIDALLKAYRGMGALSAEEAFRTWLGRIASRVCWQLRRREALMPLLQLSALEQENAEIPDPAPTAEDQAAGVQIKEIFRAALASLPAEYREVYELRAIEELSGQETAERLGISIAAMKSRWHRARKLLRERLDAALMSGEHNRNRQGENRK
jgi:RNA polymerase sigma-70 factor, ECF subfamily